MIDIRFGTILGSFLGYQNGTQIDPKVGPKIDSKIGPKMMGTYIFYQNYSKSAHSDSAPTFVSPHFRTFPPDVCIFNETVRRAP